VSGDPISFSITSAGNAPVRVRAHAALRGERIDVAQFAIVPDLDMAGARGAAIAARTIVLGD
jgi:hypothetical protein